MNCDDELFMNFCWVHNKSLNSSWTVHELMMNGSWAFIHLTSNVNFPGTIDELFMNYFCFITSFEQFMNCDGELFMN